MKENQIVVGDTYRLKTSTGYRVWKCVGEHLGATHHENIISLKALDLEPGSAYGKTQETLLVPSAILEASPLERC